MKKLLIILLSLTMGLTVSAQRHFHSHVVVGGYAPYYPYSYGIGLGYGYPYPYYPYGYGYYSRPTKLDLQIEDIKNDYAQRIWGARHDNSLSGKERRQEVRQLKHDRDQEIIDAKRNYYKRN